MYIPLTSHVRSKTLSLHKKLSLPPSLSFSSFLPFFLPSSFLFFLSSFSRENIVYTPLSTYYREQEVNSEKKSDHSRLKLLPAVHTDPSVSFLLVSPFPLHPRTTKLVRAQLHTSLHSIRRIHYGK